ncbi:CcdB family protein [Neorhizobium sp. IRAMC:178]|uniref:CcdB family protein n=1 Tax=Neorhizobium tunisiense TaxID=3144793 RepID=UPI0031F6BA8F
MARFQVYRMGTDLALDVQTNLLDALHTRVVVPLVPERDVKRIVNRLNPRFQVNDTPYIMMTEFLAAVPVGELGVKVVDVSAHSDEIVAATDFLFQGF